MSEAIIERVRSRLQSRTPSRIEDSSRINAAVLIPFLEKNGQLHLVFTKRTRHVQHHRGEICFPGGSVESNDPDLLTTALRELQEEIAVPPDSVEVLGCLDEMKTAVSNFLVVPYVGLIEPGATFRKNDLEVEEILEVPLEHFQNPEIFSENVRIVDNVEYVIYYYQWREHTIWGVTGRILKSLLDLIFEGVKA